MEVISAKKATTAVVKTAQEAGRVAIGTHAGTHHLDEVISCVLLRILYPNCLVVRSRDAEVLDLCNIVVDVGGTYDAERKRFDHHQKAFDGTWSSEKTVRLSSAGLVWKHYGKQLLEKMLEADAVTIDDALVDVLYTLIFEAVDAGDNGVKPCLCGPEEIQYKGGMPGLAGLVSACNMSWLKWEDESNCFKKAVAVVEMHFIPLVKQLGRNWQRAAAEITNAPRKPLGATGKSALVLNEYYMYAKFLKFILPNSSDVVGAIWQKSENEWWTLFRPLPWGQVAPKLDFEEELKGCGSESEALARLTKQTAACAMSV